MIWLVTIRNRHVIIVSCATILVGVQGLSLLVVRDRYHMGNGYLLEYLGKLLAIDVFFLLSLSALFHSTLHYTSTTITESLSLSKLSNTFSAINGIFSEIHRVTKAVLMLITVVTAFIGTPFGVMSIFIPLFWPMLIGTIIQSPMYFYFSPIQRFLPAILLSYDKNAAISGWILYVSLTMSIIFTKRSIWFLLYLLFIFLLLNNILGCRASLQNM